MYRCTPSSADHDAPSIPQALDQFSVFATSLTSGCQMHSAPLQAIAARRRGRQST
jgi:hypothetical protein